MILINAAPISLYTEAVARGISLNLMGIVVLIERTYVVGSFGAFIAFCIFWP